MIKNMCYVNKKKGLHNAFMRFSYWKCISFHHFILVNSNGKNLLNYIFYRSINNISISQSLNCFCIHASQRMMLPLFVLYWFFNTSLKLVVIWIQCKSTVIFVLLIFHGAWILLSYWDQHWFYVVEEYQFG